MATEPVVTVTRQELYEKVWSTPLTQLGPTYGVTHIHLANICDGHDVPRPPRGYWQQKAFGKDSPKPPLPACDDPALENVRISPDPPRDVEPTASPPVLTQPRPTVAALGDEETPKTWVTVLDERMSLRLEEGLDREEKIDSFFSHRHEYSYAPNGKLTLRIDDFFGGNCRKQWSDSTTTLENRLNTVVTGMVTAANATRAVREANERRERERKEEARRREEREQRERQHEAGVPDFEQKLAAWERAERIRAFIAAVRTHAIHSGVSIIPDRELDRWIAWALRRADRIDPVVTDRPERRWPPPAGHRVKLPNQSYPWRSDEWNGTLVLPPGPVNPSANGTTETNPSDS